MLVNQKTKQRKMSPEIRKMLDDMYAYLGKSCAEKAEMMRELNQPLHSNFRQPETLETQQPLEKMLLTPRDVEGIKQIQALCHQIERIRQHINTLNVVYELGLKPAHFFELTDLLVQLDKMIQSSKIAAKKLGIKTEMLPKAKYAEQPTQQANHHNNAKAH